MEANLKGALAELNKSWRWFKHKGQALTREQVKAVLEYGISKGYQSTADLTDPEVDHVLATMKKSGSQARLTEG